jgi:hypothetical protein
MIAGIRSLHHHRCGVDIGGAQSRPYLAVAIDAAIDQTGLIALPATTAYARDKRYGALAAVAEEIMRPNHRDRGGWRAAGISPFVIASQAEWPFALRYLGVEIHDAGKNLWIQLPIEDPVSRHNGDIHRAGRAEVLDTLIKVLGMALRLSATSLGAVHAGTRCFAAAAALASSAVSKTPSRFSRRK